MKRMRVNMDIDTAMKAKINQAIKLSLKDKKKRYIFYNKGEIIIALENPSTCWFVFLPMYPDKIDKDLNEVEYIEVDGDKWEEVK